MTISSTIASIKRHISAAYEKIANKNGSVPQEKNLANLAEAIDGIPSSGGNFKIPTERTESPYGVVHLMDWETGEIKPYYLTNNGANTLMNTYSMQGRIISLEYANGSETATIEVTAGNLVGVDLGNVVSQTATQPSFLQQSVNLHWFSFSPQNQFTIIKENFLASCLALDSPITVPASVVNIQNNFMQACQSLNQPVTLPNGLLEIGNSFMTGCKSFNQPIDFPQSLTKIGANFLSGCVSFNQPIILPAIVIDIGYFLADANSFDIPVDLSDAISSSSAPRDFMRGCKSFNQSLLLPANSLTGIGVNFMSGCTNFNQDLKLPDSVISIGNSFMVDTDSFTSTINLNNVERVGNSFMQCGSNNTQSNGIVVAPKLKTIGNQFLDGCFRYNREINLPAIETIGSSFLDPGVGRVNQVFNSKVNLGENLTTIGGTLMNNLISFNQPFKIPEKLTLLPTSFMYRWESFDQPLVIPPTVKTIGNSFMDYCYAYSHKIVIPETVQSIGAFPFRGSGVEMTEVETNCPPPNDPSGYGQYILSTDREDAPAYVNGIKISGKYAEQWIAKYPNRDTTPFRNLVLANSEQEEAA